MKLKRLSASCIKTFEQCQLKYKAEYEDGLKSDPHPLTKMGSAVHSMFEWATVCARQKNGDENPRNYKELACAQHKVDKEHYPLVDELTENCIRWGWFRNVKDSVGCEVEFDFYLPDDTPVKGFIDRLDVKLPEATVHDLKTQKAQFTDVELANNWQAKIYNIAARKLRTDITGAVRVSFWVLRHQVQPVWLTAEDAARDTEALMVVAREIRGCMNPTGSPSPLCQWCPMHNKCLAETMGIKARMKSAKRIHK